MNILCAASAAGAAVLAALAGCRPSPEPIAPEAVRTLQTVPPVQTLASMSTEPPPDAPALHTRSGGAFAGIRPTGSGADGIQP